MTRLILLSILLLSILVITSNAQKEDTNDKLKEEKESTEKTDTYPSIFAMEYLPVGHLRVDPVISQDCLSDHVHTFYGPPKIHPSVTYDDLRDSTKIPFEATSGNILENQSLYWHPTFYKTNSEGIREIVEPDWLTIYYSFENGITQSFPEGFRMIGEPPDGLKFVCYSSSYDSNKDDTAKKNSGSNYKNTDNITKKDIDDYNTTKAKETDETVGYSSYFPSEPCEEMAASLVFPTCWDGVNLDSEDHKSHVAYAIGSESATLKTFGRTGLTCPDSHPVLLPQILLFIRFVDYGSSGGSYELSNGNGAGWHADYIMGWEDSFLQNMMENCSDLKDIPCGSTRLRNIFGTASNKLVKWADMAKSLKSVRVPMANSSCITEESIHNIEMIPRGQCVGSIRSVDSCPQPEFPSEHLVVEDSDTDVGNSGVGSNERISLSVLSIVLLTTVFVISDS